MPITSWTNDFVALVVITDPIGLIPIFLGLTVGMTKTDRQQTALIAAIISFVIIAIFVLGGIEVLAAMGISLDAFRVAGGILLFYIAFEMIFEKTPERRAKTAEIAVSRDHIRNIAAFPLAMPLIAGPGTLSASILMATKHSGFSGLAMSLGIVAIAVIICYICMLLATPIERVIGDTGRSIVAKLFGILLAAMAVQFVANGLRALLFA
ncbi:MAG: MarC family protein [Candidatus Tokpelaia sp.]|uniref:MarC family protein n=1 Tax=Candidatus Tokpelaia sp. TaxID=2233777 RepID=UPI00123996CF|nr:MarC family protein [Candidatus Tokpelaia sp.]KAA6206667.1 MAG: MarC family protein [Candidatus Tokpelaia sp.]KAA6206962.1 MAG: MarC family protein [Candidatus Tokpelaia sp.]KAA6405550.1 MarC family protein [Candidatus Tokpelaia sp.]